MTESQQRRSRWLRIADFHRMPSYKVVLARPNDLRLLAAIEIAAARLLAGHALIASSHR